MPVVDLESPDVRAPRDTQKNFFVTPGAEDFDIPALTDVQPMPLPPPEKRKPTEEEINRAALRTDNTIASAISAGFFTAPRHIQEGFNAWEKIKGTSDEEHWDRFVEVRNDQHFDIVQRSIQQEREDRDLLNGLPWYQSMPARMMAAVLDWPTLLPGGAFVRGAKGGFSLLKSGAQVGAWTGVAAGAQEVGLHATQSLRTPLEIAVDISASTLLGGIIGTAGAKLLTRAEWNSAVRNIERQAAEYLPQPEMPVVPIGAAAIDPDFVKAFPFDARAEVAAIPATDAPAVISATAKKRTDKELTLFQFLAANGGLKPHPDLDATLGGSRFIPGYGPLVRKNGKSLDEARRAALEAGYLEDVQWREGIAPQSTDEGSLLDLIQAESHGNKRYPIGREPDLSGDKVTLSKMSDEELNYVDRTITASLEDSGIPASALDDDLLKRTMRIYRERGGDPLNAYEDAIMEAGKELDGKAKILHEEFGDIPGWDVPADAGAALKGSRDLPTAGPRGDLAGERAGGIVGEGARELGAGNAPTALGAAANIGAGIKAYSISGRTAAPVAAATQRLNPGLRIMHSVNPDSREVGLNLFEMTQYTRGNEFGIATPIAAETYIKEWDAGLTKAVEETRAAYKEYRKAVGTLKRDGFEELVGMTNRRGDVHEDQFVTKAAQSWRKNVFDPLKDAAVDVKLLPDGVKVETAASYFSRLWNRRKLEAEEGLFKKTVSDWVLRSSPQWLEDFNAGWMKKLSKLREASDAAPGTKGNKLTGAERAFRDAETEYRVELEARFGDKESIRSMADDIAKEIFGNLTGKNTDSVRLEYLTIKARGPLKERTFNIPDELVERWLDSNVMDVGRRYNRIMSADVEITRKFGSPDMKDALQKVRDGYDKLRAATTDQKELAALNLGERNDIRDLEGVRDLIRGNYQLGAWEKDFGRIVRVANAFQYITRMGQVTLASINEPIRSAVASGLKPVMQGSFAALTNMPAIKLVVNEAKLAGNINDRVLSHRLATLTEINDFYSSKNRFEKFMENMTNVASKWNGIRLWTDFTKSTTAVYSQHRLLDASINFSKAAAEEKRFLAFTGI